MTLKQKLEFHYNAFDRSAISPDPLQFLHMFPDRNNIEVMGFLASVFAYGNVKQIISSLNEIIKLSSGEPYNFIQSFNRKIKINIKHRFYTPEDLQILLLLIKNIYLKYSSLENLFMLRYSASDNNIKNTLSSFSSNLIQEAAVLSKGRLSSGVKFMFPDPSAGSACKRFNLFLRWMVRKDELDFGLWKGVRKDQLIIPVDTHIARIAGILNLTRRKNVSWNMAEEITGKLKKYDPSDPVKYDFALCHIGMRKMEI